MLTTFYFLLCGTNCYFFRVACVSRRVHLHPVCTTCDKMREKTWKRDRERGGSIVTVSLGDCGGVLCVDKKGWEAETKRKRGKKQAASDLRTMDRGEREKKWREYNSLIKLRRVISSGKWFTEKEQLESWQFTCWRVYISSRHWESDSFARGECFLLIDWVTIIHEREREREKRWRAEAHSLRYIFHPARTGEKERQAI